MLNIKELFFREINIDFILRRLLFIIILATLVTFSPKYIQKQEIMQAAFWGAAWAGIFTFLVTSLFDYYKKERDDYNSNWLLYQELIMALDTLADNRKDFEALSKNVDKRWLFNLRPIQCDYINLKSLKYLEVLNEMHGVYLDFHRYNKDISIIEKMYYENFQLLKEQSKDIKDNIIKFNNEIIEYLKQFIDRNKKLEEHVINAYSIMDYLALKDNVNWLNAICHLCFGYLYNKKIFEKGREIRKAILLKCREKIHL